MTLNKKHKEDLWQRIKLSEMNLYDREAIYAMLRLLYLLGE